MSGKFGGFSQDDINKIKSSNSNNKENAKTTLRPALKSSKPVPKVAPSKPQAPPSTASTTANTPHQPADISSSSLSTTNGEHSLQDALHFQPLPQPTYGAESVSDTGSAAGTKQPDPSGGNAEQLVQPLKGVSLREFEAQRRMVEEQNKHKKAMLYKVIEQHSERTAAEAKKLTDIKHELAKLESDLAVDVSILRKQIDAASLRYMKAQANYTQVESVFLKARLELQQTREKQDMLAEHLNIIIANNEDRKAEKLADLMAKVGLCSNGESLVDA